MRMLVMGMTGSAPRMGDDPTLRIMVWVLA